MWFTISNPQSDAPLLRETPATPELLEFGEPMSWKINFGYGVPGHNHAEPIVLTSSRFGIAGAGTPPILLTRYGPATGWPGPLMYHA